MVFAGSLVLVILKRELELNSGIFAGTKFCSDKDDIIYLGRYSILGRHIIGPILGFLIWMFYKWN